MNLITFKLLNSGVKMLTVAISQNKEANDQI